MIRYYVLPKIGTGTPEDPWRPKYVNELVVPWGGYDYGGTDTIIVVAEVNTTQHSTISSDPETLSIPANIDQNLTQGASDIAQNYLEGLNIPGGWVNPSHTYREVLRILYGFFTFAQRYFGITEENIKNIGLNTKFKNMPKNVKQGLIDAADEFNLDTSSFNPNSTTRQILKAMADQFGDREYSFNPPGAIL